MDKKALEALILKTSGDDNAAFEELYCLMKSSIFSFAYSICKDFHTAEDILQDTFIKIKLYASSYLVNTNPKAWMLTITKHIALNKMRSIKYILPLDSEDYINISYKDDKTTEVDNRILIEQLLCVLNDNERQIVCLHAISDMKHADIAKILDKPYGTVLWTYSNAMKKLKNNIK